MTCLCLDGSGEVLVSGSRDQTLIVWNIGKDYSIDTTPRHLLYGHEKEVTCVAVCTELDIIASASKVKIKITKKTENPTWDLKRV